MSGAITLKAILIDVANIKIGPKSGFSPRVNNHLYKYFEAIKFSTALLHFDLN